MKNLFIYFDEHGNVFQSKREPELAEIEEWEDGLLDIVKVTYCDNEKVLEIERIDGTEIEEKEIIGDAKEEEKEEEDLEQNEN